MRRLRVTLLSIFFLLTCFEAVAQSKSSLTGTVKDQKGQPIPGATVFLTNSQYKTATNNNGRFVINDVETGNYQLVIKMLGFAAYVIQLNISGKQEPLTITLTEEKVLLNTVTINASEPNRKQYLAQFIKYFIGESANASRCKILNPQALAFHFDKETRILQASADTILQIENDGLGYTLNYVLTEFKIDNKNNKFSYMGYPYFEELKGTDSQERRWEKNRKEAYLGSQRHFFRSVYNNATVANGFLIYVKDMPVTSASLFTAATGDVKIFSHRAKDSIYVFYREKVQPFSFEASGLSLQSNIHFPTNGQLSALQPLADSVLVDKNGALTPSKSFYMSGYWAWQKIAELLPLGYHVAAAPLPVTKTDNPGPADITEKAYLHLDRKYYSAGDTIWFKAYVVDGSEHRPSLVSNVLNVELVDGKDSVKQRVKLLVKNGLSNGDFRLPFTVADGTYHVRAFTNWMRNAGDEYFFDEKVTIINPVPELKRVIKTINNIKIDKKTVSTKSAAPAVDIQFFPEGGTFAVDVPEKIAFKVTDAVGKGINITGTINDDRDNVVASIASNQVGMGTFFITADAGRAYKAKVRLPDSSVRIIELPKAVSNGYVLSVRPAGTDNIMVAAQPISDKNIALPSDQLTLTGSVGGVVYYKGKSKAGNNSLVGTIAKNKFPTGIVQFTLYASNGEPTNERLVFVQNDDQLKLDIASAKKTYIAEQKTKIDLVAKNSYGQPVQGSFSVVVTNENKLPDDKGSNILSNLLLTSDLKGYIETPAYYFTSTNQQATDDLDALMLTQGYRMFKWKKDSTNIYPPEHGLSVSGYLKTLSNRPVANGKVMLLANGDRFLTLDTVADKNGHFVFNNLFYTDSTRFMLQGAAEKERYNLQIILDKPVSPNTAYSKMIDLLIGNDTSKKASPFIETAKAKREVQERYHITDKDRILKEVTIRDVGPPPVKYSENLNGPGRADQVFTAEDIASFKCGFITTCLEGRLQGISLSSAGANSYFYLSRLYSPGISPPPMMILIDGMSADIGQLNALSPNSIESIEVLRSLGMTAIYGGKGAAGILVITLKRGADMWDLKSPSPGTIVFQRDGFYKAREFYSPNYDSPETNKEIANLRSTIYWNPALYTDKDGKASFEFFNAVRGTYRVVVEGIDGQGRLGHSEYRYKVE